jgi:hypothetical protein
MTVWPFRRKTPSPPSEPERSVILVRFDTSTRIVPAIRSQSGWVSDWWGDPQRSSSLVILRPDGKVIGSDLVTRWYPHAGWIGNEFSQPSPEDPTLVLGL